METCIRCGCQLHLENGVWVDNSGGDGCFEKTHLPPLEAIKFWDKTNDVNSQTNCAES